MYFVVGAIVCPKMALKIKSMLLNSKGLGRVVSERMRICGREEFVDGGRTTTTEQTSMMVAVWEIKE